MTTTPPLLEVADLRVQFRQGFRRPVVRAVDGLSLVVDEQETVGLVGESGSGKTTIGRAILGLTPVQEGTIGFAGRDITNAKRPERRALSEHLSVIFQDPYSSLNPARTISQILSEPLLVHRRLDASNVRAEVSRALDRVGLGEEAALRYPRDFSGGQRQRIAIARALMLKPKLVICDEAVSALDLSIQAQILNLMKDLQSELALSYLFIAHDLSVVRFISDRIVVVYRGRVMESGPAASVYSAPKHPYTHALLAAMPIPDPDIQSARRHERAGLTKLSLSGSPLAGGCPFAPRCPFALPVCSSELPAEQHTEDGSTVACHRYPEIMDSTASPVVFAAAGGFGPE